MTKTLEAIFDGEVLRLIEPIELEPNTRDRLTLEVEEVKEKKTRLVFTNGSITRSRRPIRLVRKTADLLRVTKVLVCAHPSAI